MQFIEQRLSSRSFALSVHNIKAVLVTAALGLFAGALYYSRFDSVVGQVGDDAWYVLLAQGLATGQNYELINSPVSGILPNYPPAFPFLLSLVFRLLPQANENLALLKIVSLVAMAGIGLTTYRYLLRQSQLPSYLTMAVALAVTIMPAFVFLATSTVMSECAFTLGQLLTVFVIEKAVRTDDKQSQRRFWLLSALLATFTFLVRSMAVTLLAAVVIYLLKEKHRKGVLLFAGATLLLILPWMIYARMHAPTPEQKKAHGGFIIYNYGEQFWMKRGGDAESGTITWRELPARIWENGYSIAARDFCGMLLPSVLRGTEESGTEVFALGEGSGLGGSTMGKTLGTALISLCLSLLTLLGFVMTVRQRISLAEILVPCSLAITLIWSWWSFRFVLPLAPFLFHYLIVGLKTLTALSSKWRTPAKALEPWALARIFMLCVLALYAYDHWGYLKHKAQNMEAVTWLSEFNEARATLDWAAQNLPTDAVVAATNPSQFYLFTKRKAVTSGDPFENSAQWKKMGVQYLVILRPLSLTLLDDDQTRYPIIYGEAKEKMRIIDLSRLELLPK